MKVLFFQSPVVDGPHACCNWLLFGHDRDPNISCHHHLCIVSGSHVYPSRWLSHVGPETFRWGRSNSLCSAVQRHWIRGWTQHSWDGVRNVWGLLVFRVKSFYRSPISLTINIFFHTFSWQRVIFLKDVLRADCWRAHHTTLELWVGSSCPREFGISWCKYSVSKILNVLQRRRQSKQRVSLSVASPGVFPCHVLPCSEPVAAKVNGWLQTRTLLTFSFHFADWHRKCGTQQRLTPAFCLFRRAIKENTKADESSPLLGEWGHARSDATTRQTQSTTSATDWLTEN